MSISKTDEEDICPWVHRVEWEPEHDSPGIMRAIDEIVVFKADYVHVERLNESTYWMAIGKGKERQVVIFNSARSAPVFARTERDRD